MSKTNKHYTPVFRVSYPNVFKPRQNKLSGKTEYSVVALFPKSADLTALKKAVEDCIEEKWGKKRPANLRLPFKDQERKRDQETGALPEGHEAGAIYLDLKSEMKPGVVDADRNYIEEPSDFYAGCYAQATVTVYAYDQAGNRGVNFGLGNIQKVKEGDPLSGRSKAEDDFAPISNTTTAGTKTSADKLFS